MGSKDMHEIMSTAIAENRLDVVKQMVLNDPDEWFHESTYLFAVQKDLNRLDVIKLLVELGIPLNDSEGYCGVLHNALNNERIDIIEYLLHNGACPDNRYFLQTAIDRNLPEALKILLQFGCSLENVCWVLNSTNDKHVMREILERYHVHLNYLKYCRFDLTKSIEEYVNTFGVFFNEFYDLSDSYKEDIERVRKQLPSFKQEFWTLRSGFEIACRYCCYDTIKLHLMKYKNKLSATSIVLGHKELKENLYLSDKDKRGDIEKCLELFI